MSSGIVGYMYITYTQTVSSNSNEGSVISQVAGANNGGNSGGIVAYAVNGSIYDNRNDGTIESEYQAGGIVAYSKSGTITSNVNYGSVIASTKTPNSNVAAGGIVGKVSDAGQVSNNIQQGSQVTASCSKSGYTESYAGGIIGCVFYGGTVKNNKLSSKCYISSTGTYAYAAGAVGRICEKTGSVSYSKTTFVSNWSSLSKTYVNANGGTTSWVDSDANYKD